MMHIRVNVDYWLSDILRGALIGVAIGILVKMVAQAVGWA